MASPELAPVLLGLASAACWGAGDFGGGIATRRSNVFGVAIASQLLGGALLVGPAVLLAEPLPASADLLWAGAAGMVGAVGLVALYLGLATGSMGVVAPVTGMLTAGIPVVFGFFAEGSPAPPRLFGFGVALAAVWLLSGDDGQGIVHKRELGLSLLAGLAFGLFLIVIGGVSDRAVVWPLLAARIGSLALLTSSVIVTRWGARPARGQWAGIALAGIFDTGGNALYALAARAGRLDVAAVLSSLYPATTILLAWLVLKERLGIRQRAGAVAALVAVVLIAS